ncbi:hypothetical protein [Nostoc sp. CCY0012]|uniref:hypothetical protein n=1 Tax=Nostoc sp. CCY0012 TaxID=1056123 RepID=UPI0039C6D4AE
MSSCSQIENEIAALRTDIAALNNKFATKKEVEVLRQEIAKLKSIDEAKIIREAANRALTEIQPQLGFKADKADVNNLKSLVDNINSRLKGQERKPNTNSDLANRVSKLERYCESLEKFILETGQKLSPFVDTMITFFDFFQFIFK